MLLLYVLGGLLPIIAGGWAFLQARNHLARIDDVLRRSDLSVWASADQEALLAELKALGGGMGDITVHDHDVRLFVLGNRRLVALEVKSFWRQGALALLGVALGTVASVWSLHLPLT